MTVMFFARRILVAAALCAAVGAREGMAVPISVDDAGRPAYASGWTNGSNGASNTSVLGGWVFGGSATPGTTAFSSSSTGLGTSGTIDANGRSFRLSDTTNSGSYIDVFRFLGSDLQAGYSLSLDMQVNFRSGYKGVRMRGADDSTTIFRFEVGNQGSGDDYVVLNAATGAGSIGNAYSSDSRFNILLSQTSASGGTWTVTRSGGVSSVATGNYAGTVSSFQFYTVGAGSAGENAAFYNNIAVVPEPATSAMLAGAAVLCGLGLRRRRSSPAV